MLFILKRHKKEGKRTKSNEGWNYKPRQRRMWEKKQISHSRNYKKVTFENEETPNEFFVEISPNEVITPSRKKNKQDKRKRAMVDDESIPIDYEEIIDLDETHLNHKRKKKMLIMLKKSSLAQSIIVKFLMVVEK